MPARSKKKKMCLWAKISTVWEFSLHTGFHSPMQKWHRDLMLITVTLSGSANYLRAAHSMSWLMDSGTCLNLAHLPKVGEFPWFLETLFPLHQFISGLLMLCWNKLLLNYRLLHWPQLCPEYQQLLLLLFVQTKETLFSPLCFDRKCRLELNCFSILLG